MDEDPGLNTGESMENPHVESFIGKFRDECLNRAIFKNGKEAQVFFETGGIVLTPCGRGGL